MNASDEIVREGDAGGEPVNLGVAKSAHAIITRLKEDGHFREMVDAYRFAVGLALAHGGKCQEFSDRQNMFNRGSLDPDGSLYPLVEMLRVPTQEPIGKTIEKLATWGLHEIDRRLQRGTLSYASIIEEVRSGWPSAGDSL